MRHCSIFLFLLLGILPTAKAQKQSTKLVAFENFMKGRWEMKGSWPNGQKFRQVQQFEWGLNRHIIKVKTWGTVNQKTGNFGLRNEGIRTWDTHKKQIVFWEFDIFGGITQGTCTIEGKNMYYDYSYQGKTFRDSWVYIEPNKYAYKVGIYTKGQWQKVFLASTYQRIKK